MRAAADAVRRAHNPYDFDDVVREEGSTAGGEGEGDADADGESDSDGDGDGDGEGGGEEVRLRVREVSK